MRSPGPSWTPGCPDFRLFSNGEPIEDATHRLAIAGQAERQLDVDELAAIRQHPDEKCDRCDQPMAGDGHMLTLSGAHVTGSVWLLCLQCTGDLMRWLGNRNPDGTPGPGPRPPAPVPRSRHQ